MSLTLRSTKGSPLTYAEADANFSGLADLSLTTFLQSGTGAVTRTVQSKERDFVSVKDFGAVGDGSTDDTIALAAAAATGFDVYFPRVSNPSTQYYKTTAAIALNSNQRVFGDGWGSLIRISGSTTLNVFSAVSKDRVIVDNLHVYAGGGISSGADGIAVFLQGCTKSAVRNCFIENPGSSAIQLYNTSDSSVTGNTILPGSSPPPIQEVDIFLRAGSSRNTVTGNHCASTGDSAIGIQTVTASDAAIDNVIEGNVIDTYARYGIYAYRQNLTDTVYRNKILGNSIRNITGASSDDGGVTKPYGTGIYIQGAEYSVVNDNTIDTVNAQTNSETLAPAAIGSTNVTNVEVVGNQISNCTKHGITIRDPNTQGLSTGFANVVGNTINTVAGQGIYVLERGRFNIQGNTFDGLTSRGVFVSNSTTKRPACSINGNVVRNAGHNGIDATFCAGLVVSGNNVKGQALAGITVDSSDNVSVTGNVCVNGSSTAGSVGIQVASGVANGCIVDSNLVTTNAIGMLLQANLKIGKNKVFGNTTDWSGNYAVLRGAWDLASVGNIGGGEDDLKTFVLPASAFTVNTQSVRITAWGTTANNNNPKTVKLYFGTNNTLSFALTVSQISPWKIIAEVGRSGVSTQSATAMITQGGTAAGSGMATASPAETETAAITIKCTGTVTNGGGGIFDNDITQTGLLVEFIDS